MKKVDLIWDNPPYTSPETKERVLRALVGSGKPFAMLLPISVLHVGFVREIVDMEQVRDPSQRVRTSGCQVTRAQCEATGLGGQARWSVAQRLDVASNLIDCA